MGIFCGLGFLTKGFIAVVLPALVFVVTAISLSRFKEVLCYAPIALMSMVFIASAPGVISVALQAPDYWHYFFWVEHVQRFVAKGISKITTYVVLFTYCYFGYFALVGILIWGY